MAQQRILFEWVIDDDPIAPWQGGRDETAPESPAREAFWMGRLGRVLSLALAALCLTTGVGLTHDQQAQLIAQDGIEFALNQENLAWRTRDRGLFETLIDPKVSDEWRDEWRDYWRSGAEATGDYDAQLLYVQAADGWIEATVMTQQPALEWWQTSPYRETRFYRRVGQSWLRSAPPAESWGKQGRLETAHLAFEYYAKDEVAVRAAATTLERAYGELYPLLGLPLPPENVKLTIQVLPAPVGRWTPARNELDVMSPRLAQIPLGQSEAEYLAYDVMGWFTYRALRDATPGTDGRYLYRWPILVWGLRGWLRDDLLDQPSPWRVEARRVFQEAAPQYLPLGLSNITELEGDGRPTRQQVIMRYIAAESFVSFVMATYGRERLPELLKALIHHGSWEEIATDLYGHSVEKLVADWNIYLLAEYGTEAAP
ncbi:MAG: hypothetical protein IT329_15855 [Caldilineaceae bacterium]|nr:hypothetical protein [Caldilineaceae bacterium]